MEPQIHGLCNLLIISTPYRTIIALLLHYYCSIIVLLLQNLCTIQPPDTGACRLASFLPAFSCQLSTTLPVAIITLPLL